MPEWVERMMHALGWMPVERERVLEAVNGELMLERDRALRSWDNAEARIVVLEAERAELASILGSMELAKQAVWNARLRELSFQAERIAQ